MSGFNTGQAQDSTHPPDKWAVRLAWWSVESSERIYPLIILISLVAMCLVTIIARAGFLQTHVFAVTLVFAVGFNLIFWGLAWLLRMMSAIAE